MANERKLRISIDSSGAKTGANQVVTEVGKIKKAGEEALKLFKELESTFNKLGGIKKLKDSIKSLQDTNKELQKQASEVDKVKKANEELTAQLNKQKKAGDELTDSQKELQAIQNKIAKEERANSSEMVEAKQKLIKLTNDRQKAEKEFKASLNTTNKEEEKTLSIIAEQTDAEKIYQKEVNKSLTARQLMTDEGKKVIATTVKGTEALNDYKKEVRDGIKAEKDAQRALADNTSHVALFKKQSQEALDVTKQGIAVENQLRQQKAKSIATSDEQLKQQQLIKVAEQERTRVAREAAKAELGLVKTGDDRSATLKEQEALTNRAIKAEAKLSDENKELLERVIRADEAIKKFSKTVRDEVSALSSSEKASVAYQRAHDKLENTLYAEQGRLEALNTEMGKQSVKTQEQRRLTEELSRAKERLNLLQSAEGKQLVQTRMQAEMLNKQYREQIKGTKEATLSVTGLQAAFSSLGTVLAGVSVYFSAMGLARVSDDYTNMTNRLAAVTQGTVDVTEATREMLEVSMETRSSMDAVMDVYTKMIRVNETLGKSQQEVADLTTAVSKAVSMSGASVQGAQGAIMQFAQAMSADWATSAQELNSILEQTPALAYYMVKGLNQMDDSLNLTTGTLKRFAEEGGLSAEKVFQALLNVLPDIEKAFGETDQTISSALQNLRDSFTVTLGEIDKASGVGQDLVAWIKDLAEELPNLQDELIAVTAGITGILTVVAGGTLWAILGGLAGTVLGLASAAGVLTGSIAYLIATSRGYEDDLEDYNTKLEQLTETTERFNAAVDVMNPTKLRDTIYGSEGDSGLIKDTAEAFEDLAKRQEKVNQLQAKYDQEKNSFFWTYVIPTNTKQELEEAISLMNLAQETFDKYVDRYNNAMDNVDSSKLDYATEGLRGFVKSVESFNPTKKEKAYQTYLNTINKFTESYTAQKKKIDDVTDAEQKAAMQKQLDASMTLLVANAQEVLNEALAKGTKKTKDYTASRLQTIADLDLEITKLREGKEAYEAYQLRIEAMDDLNIDSSTFDPSKQKELNDLLTAHILQLATRKQLLEDMDEAERLAEINRNAQGVLASYKEQYSALLDGEDALKEFQATQQAINTLGFQGLSLTDEQKKTVQELKELLLGLQTSTGNELSNLFDNMSEQVDPILKINNAYDAQIEKINEVYEADKKVLDARKEAGKITQKEYDAQVASLDNIKAGANDLAKDTKDQDMFSHISTNLTQGVSSFQKFAEITGSGVKEMQVAMDALNVVTAIQAVLTQGSGDPYTAFARMAAMAAAVAQLGYSVGSFGGGDPTASRQASQGTGTVLGDSSAKSESILNAVENSADALDQIVGINTSMLNALENLTNAISGASTLIARDVSYSDLSGSLGLSSGASLYQDLGSGAGKLFDSLFLGMTDGLFESILGGIGGFIGGGLFGSSSVVDEGVQIIGGTLADILEETTVKSYQEIKKKSWFGSSKSTKYASVSEAVEQQFDLVFQSIFDTVEQSALGLGYQSSDIQEALQSFVVDASKISLEDLSGEEISEELNAVFSSIFDNLAADVVPLVTELQQAGEGAGETLARLATNMTVVTEVIDQLNLSALNGSTDDNIRAATALAELMGGASELASGLTGFVETFATEERQLEILQGNLTDALGEQDKAILKNRDSVYDYVKALDVNNEADQVRLANILSLTDSLDEYFDLVDSVTEAQEDLNEALSDYTDLQIRLANAQGDTDLATRLTREQELAEAVDDTTRSYLKAIYAAEDLTSQLTLLNSVSSQLSSNTDRVFSAFSSMVTDLVSDLEDARDSALTDLETTYDSDITALEKALEDQKTALETQLDDQLELNDILKDSLSDTISELNSLISAVQSAADSLQTQLVSEAINRRSAINTLRNYLLTGDTTGVADAASVASSISSTGFTSSADYQFEQARTLYLLRQVEEAGGNQLSTAELSLKELEDGNELLEAQTDKLISDLEEHFEDLIRKRDQQFEDDQEAINASYDADIQFYEDTRDFYEEQIDLFRNINVSFSDFSNALESISTALTNEQSGTSAYTSSQISEAIDSIISMYDTTTSSGWIDAVKDIANTATEFGVSFNEIANAMGLSVEEVTQAYNNATSGIAGTSVGESTKNSPYSTSEITNAAQSIIDSGNSSGLSQSEIYKQIGEIAIANGVSSSELAVATGMSQEEILKNATALGLPMFAKGLDAGSHSGGWMVTGDKFGANSPSAELVHTTSAANVMNRPQYESLINVEGLITEIRELKAEIVKIKQEAIKTSRNTKSIADDIDAWDVEGMPQERTGVL